MVHDPDACRGCLACVPYCPMGAIGPRDGDGGAVDIDRRRCVECGTCARTGICPENAFRPEALAWPRVLRSMFSDPVTVHQGTRVPGRGTEEMKTNDVTGRFPAGILGIAIEVGRPGLSASFADLQDMTTACAALGVDFEDDNPLTSLMADRVRGLLRPDILEERVLSALIEMKIPRDRLPQVLRGLAEAAKSIHTVFSLGVSGIASWTEDTELFEKLGAMGISVRPNGKVNIGLGRPLRDLREDP